MGELSTYLVSIAQNETTTSTIETTEDALSDHESVSMVEFEADKMPEKVSDPANIQKIRTHFNYSLDEKYLNDFLCTYQTPQKHQQLGHLVLFEHHLCFVQDPSKLESNRLLEGYADIGRPGKKWKRHFIIANNDHLSIASHKENVYKVSTVIPWCDVFSVEKTDQAVALRENSISLTTSKRNYFISLDSEKEVDTWVHLIKTKIAVAQSPSESTAFTQEGNIQVQLTFSLSYLRVNDVEICNSYLYPNSIFIQFDNDQELIFLHMDESDAAQKTVKEQVQLHRSKSSKKPFKFMNIFTRTHSQARFSIDADSVHKDRHHDENASTNGDADSNSDTTNTNNTNVQNDNGPIPVEPSFFVVSDNDRHLFKSKFKFPSTEQLHAVYHCALFKSFDFNGKLFLSDNYISFWNTNIIDHFSKQNKIIIPFTEVIAIKKYKTMHFITSGLRIVTRDNTFNFIHLKKTSKVITFLNKLWVQAKRRKGEVVNLHRTNSNEELPSNVNLEQFKSIPPKRITITLVGTRGDVQPFVALALKLQEFGHKVKIATHKLHQPFVESYNIAFAPISGDPRELIKLCVTNDTFSLKFIREANKHFKSFMQDIIYTCWEACKSDTDVLIENPPCFAGIHIAEKLNIPFIVAFTMPWTQTSQFPHPFAMGGKTTSIYNLSSYFVLQQSTFLMLRPMINKLRTQVLGLQPISTSDSNAPELRKTHYMYCWSPSVVPKPHDWGRRVHVVGYWFLDAPKDFVPSPELQAFLAKEPKPIYIGFGSIIVKDPDALTKTIIEGVRLSGQRAILAKGWGGTNVEQYPDFIFPLDAVPHDWLFPQLTAAVHHGGAGTTAAAYRAGIPTMIVPFFGDQFFWAQRTEALGVGPKHIKVDELTPENFGAALKQMAVDQTMRKKAETLGVHIREQHGPARAVQVIHQAIQEFERAHSDGSNERPTNHGELKVTVKNDTRFKLFRKQWQLKNGTWINVPPDYVLPFTSADVTIRMDKLHINSIEGFMEYACDYKPLQQSKKPLKKRRSDSELKIEKVAVSDNPLVSPRRENISVSNRAANQSLVSDTEMKPIQQTATFFFVWNNFGASKKYSYDSSNALIVDYRKTSDGIEFTVQEPATNITELKTLTMSIMKRELSDADIGGEENADSSSSSSELDLNSNKQNAAKQLGKTVTVTINNKTDIVFKRDQNVLKHGEWLTFPPERIPKQNTISFIAFQGPNHVHKPTGFIAYAIRLHDHKEIMSVFFKITTQKNRLKSRVECSLLDATVETDEKSNLIITLEPKRVDIRDNNLNPNNTNVAKVEVKDEATMEQEIKELKESKDNSEKHVVFKE